MNSRRGLSRLRKYSLKTLVFTRCSVLLFIVTVRPAVPFRAVNLLVQLDCGNHRDMFQESTHLGLELGLSLWPRGLAPSSLASELPSENAHGRCSTRAAIPRARREDAQLLRSWHRGLRDCRAGSLTSGARGWALLTKSSPYRRGSHESWCQRGRPDHQSECPLFLAGSLHPPALPTG